MWRRQHQSVPEAPANNEGNEVEGGVVGGVVEGGATGDSVDIGGAEPAPKN